MSLLPWRLVAPRARAVPLRGDAWRARPRPTLGDAAGHSDSALGVLRAAGVGAGASNLANNLPSYLALERVTDGRQHQLLGLLLGTNVGPLVLLWGSLATLLWRERCRGAGRRDQRVGVRPNRPDRRAGSGACVLGRASRHLGQRDAIVTRRPRSTSRSHTDHEAVTRRTTNVKHSLSVISWLLVRHFTVSTMDVCRQSVGSRTE